MNDSVAIIAVVIALLGPFTVGAGFAFVCYWLDVLPPKTELPKAWINR